MNCLLPVAALCLFWGFATACDLLGCTSEAEEWATASTSGDKDRLCSAGSKYVECLGSDCPAADAITATLEAQGCSSGSDRVWMSASSLLLTVVLTKIVM